MQLLTSLHAEFEYACVPCSLLRGAEQIGMYKQVKSQYGGGIRRFSCEEDTIYENIESELCFFTSQVSLWVRFYLKGST